MQEFSLSTRIFFGDHALDCLRKIRNRTVMIVTDSFLIKSGAIEHVVSHLAECNVTIFQEVTPDPTTEVVATGIKCLLQSGAEVMIAVGGGSVIDAAKAIRSIANQNHLLKNEIVECFAIPTTSGTGSEVTEYAVISDSEKGGKYPLVSRDMRPPVAILDPSLVITAPPAVTADSGMDALTHAIEAYVSTGANDFTDALAEKAAQLVVQYLPDAYKNGGNILAREKMHNASCIAGLAFNSAGLGLCHGIAHSLGSQFHLSHGRVNAMLLPHIIEFNASTSEQPDTYCPNVAGKYRTLAKRLGLSASSVLIGVNQLIRLIEGLNRTMNIPSSLRLAKVDQTLLTTMESDIVDAALKDITTASNPRTPLKSDVAYILQRVSGY